MEGRVVETTLRQTPNQRHLATFKSETKTAAGARLLPLVPFAARLAVTGTFAGTEPLDAMPRTRPRPHIVQPDHDLLGLSVVQANAAHLQNFITPAQGAQRLDRRLDHIRVIAGAKRLREHVANADRFHHRADAAARDHARPRRGRTQQNASAAKLADRLMRDRVFVQRHFLHRFARRFGCLADRLGDFIRLAESDADFAIVIARNNQRAEAKTPAAFDDLGATIDEHHLLGRVPLRR